MDTSKLTQQEIESITRQRDLADELKSVGQNYLAEMYSLAINNSKNKEEACSHKRFALECIEIMKPKLNTFGA